jgi:hypothetical protein
MPAIITEFPLLVHEWITHLLHLFNDFRYCHIQYLQRPKIFMLEKLCVSKTMNSSPCASARTVLVHSGICRRIEQYLLQF